MFRRAAGLLALASVFASMTASASEAEAAALRSRAALRALKVNLAADEARAGLKHGDGLPEQVGELYRLWAEASAILGQEEAATELYGRALQVQPSLLLPHDAPPKFTRPFAAARELGRGTPFALEVFSGVLSDGRVRTQVTVKGDLHGLVRGVALVTRPTGPVLTHLAVDAPRGEVAWTCASFPCAYYVLARDEHGNVLQQAGSAQAPLLVDLPQSETLNAAILADPTQRSWKKPVLLGGAALAAGAVSTALGLQFASTQSALLQATQQRDQHRWSDVQALDRTRRQLQLATIGTAVLAAALGISAVAVF